MDVIEANKKLTESLEKLSDKEIETFNKMADNLNTRVEKGKEALLKLYGDEAKHKDKLLALDADLAKIRNVS